jgi:anti-sigma B factor antagonist
MELQLGSHSARDDTVVVSVAGDVDNDSAPELRRALSAAFSDGASRVVVDLGKTDFLDSSGLGALVGVNKAHASDGELIVVCPKAQLRKLFQISRLDEVLPVHGDLESALR